MAFDRSVALCAYISDSVKKSVSETASPEHWGAGKLKPEDRGGGA
jgi:hypothetical protein